MSNLKLAVPLLALISSAAVQAEAKRDLVEILSGEGYNGSKWVVYIDRASRKTVADGVAVEEISRSDKARPDGSFSTVTEYVVDCAMPQTRVTREYRTNAEGKIISEETLTRQQIEWTYAGRPSTKRMIDAVCTG